MCFYAGTMEFIITALIVVAVSVIGGITGVGGVLFIPTLVVIMGMNTHMATGTVLASMILPASYASYLYARKGAMDKEILIPLCSGGVLFGYLGGLMKVHASASVLTILLAAVVIVAGLSALRAPKAGSLQLGQSTLKTRRIFLALLGSGVGLMSGLAGSGGGILTVPIMIACGFPVMPTVCAGIVFTIPAGISASIPNAMHGYIDWFTLSWIIVAQVAGMYAGVSIAAKMPVPLLRKLVAAVCIFTGVFLLARVLL